MTFIPKVERNTTHGEIVQLRAPEVPNFAFFNMSYSYHHPLPEITNANYRPISVSQYPFRPQKRKIFGKRINGTGQKKDPPSKTSGGGYSIQE